MPFAGGRRPAGRRRAAVAAALVADTRTAGSTQRRPPHRVPYRRARRRGEIDIGLSATHLETPGGRAGFLVTFQDLTDIKKLERDARLQQRLAAVGEMAAGIAHEIRNPLASMSGSIQILRQELPLSAEQEQLMDIVLRESERLNTTIRSFLAYARPRRFADRAVRSAAGAEGRGAAAAQQRRGARGAHRRGGRAGRAIWYEADEGQIRQIIWNLATNGLRAMPDGGRLRLAGARRRTRRRRHRRCRTRASASRPEDSTACSSRSTAASRRAAASAWRSSIGSSPTTTAKSRSTRRQGTGTTVVGAPAGAGGSDDMNVTDRARPRTAAAERRAPPRILVVDDERSMRELLAIVLQARGLRGRCSPRTAGRPSPRSSASRWIC